MPVSLGTSPLTPSPTATEFVARLDALRPAAERGRYQERRRSGQPELHMGLAMRDVFALAKACVAMAPAEIERLLAHPVHDARVGAVSVMDWQARGSRTPEARRRALYELYLRRHDCINNWDLVDRAAPWVVGRYLADKPRRPLYRLARSASPWERRTAITATWYFIRQGDVEDTFALADRLAHDPHELVQKAVGGWVREAGKRAPARLHEFLEAHGAAMPRVALRYAVERLSRAERDHYLGLGRARSTPPARA